MQYLVPPIPADEADRLAALRSFGLLDTPAEPAFDDVVAVAATLLDVPIALVSLVDSDRQWFKACIGLDTDHTSREVSFCAHAIAEPREHPFVVPDARLDLRFRDNPLVLDAPFVTFYAGAPILTPSGHALGTVCAIDTVPRAPSDRQLDALMALARQTMVTVSERQVLDVTLRASCRTLLESLALANPHACSRANRIREIVAALAEAAGLGARWEVEVAAMLAHIGAVTLPPATLDKLEMGAALDEAEQAQVDRMPHLANELLGNLPRLELVRAIILTSAGHGGWPEHSHAFIGPASEILRAASLIDDAEGRGMLRPAAAVLVRDAAEWRPEVHGALCSLAEHGGRGTEPLAATAAELTLGQVLAADVYSHTGVLLVGRGQHVTPTLLDRLVNFGVAEPLWVHSA